MKTLSRFCRPAFPSGGSWPLCSPKGTSRTASKGGQNDGMSVREMRKAMKGNVLDSDTFDNVCTMDFGHLLYVAL